MKNNSLCLIGVFFLAFALCVMSGCRAFNMSGSPLPTPTGSSVQTNPFRPTAPPVVKAYQDEVFAIAWYKLPYSGVFYWLRLTKNSQVDFWRVIVNFAIQGQGHTKLVGTEVQEVKELLADLVATSPMTNTEGSVRISLSFQSNSKDQFITFNENCPRELRRIFEVVESAFTRDRMVGEWIPCQN